VSGREGRTADQLSIAVEENDFERDVGALEHARGCPPRGLGDDVSEWKVYRMLERFRRRIRRQDLLAQLRTTRPRPARASRARSSRPRRASSASREVPARASSSSPRRRRW